MVKTTSLVRLLCYQSRHWSALSILRLFPEPGNWAAAEMVHTVPQRKVIHELESHYCLIECKHKGGHRKSDNALTSLPVSVCLCLSVYMSVVCLWISNKTLLICYCCHPFYCFSPYLIILTLPFSSYCLSHPPFSYNFHTPGYLQLHPRGTDRGKQVNCWLALLHY